MTFQIQMNNKLNGSAVGGDWKIANFFQTQEGEEKVGKEAKSFLYDCSTIAYFLESFFSLFFAPFVLLSNLFFF